MKINKTISLILLSVSALLSSFAYGNDAIHKAAYESNEELVIKLLTQKPDPDVRDSFGGTAMHAAMFQENMRIVELLLNAGFDINAIGPRNGYTPLHDAVWANNPVAVKFLIEYGANVSIKAKDGLTPLEKAKQEGKDEIVKIFSLKKG